jgi:hypothetical protein
MKLTPALYQTLGWKGPAPPIALKRQGSQDELENQFPPLQQHIGPTKVWGGGSPLGPGWVRGGGQRPLRETKVPFSFKPDSSHGDVGVSRGLPDIF